MGTQLLESSNSRQDIEADFESASGALAERRYQDAFGNTQQGWSGSAWSGLWGTWPDRAGWSHNTKEFDANIGMTYMMQRWYSPETGGFVSRAPYAVHIEHPYGFAGSRPGSLLDPKGMSPKDALKNFVSYLVGHGPGGSNNQSIGSVAVLVNGQYCCNLPGESMGGGIMFDDVDGIWKNRDFYPISDGQDVILTDDLNGVWDISDLYGDPIRIL